MIIILKQANCQFGKEVSAYLLNLYSAQVYDSANFLRQFILEAIGLDANRLWNHS